MALRLISRWLERVAKRGSDIRMMVRDDDDDGQRWLERVAKRGGDIRMVVRDDDDGDGDDDDDDGQRWLERVAKRGGSVILEWNALPVTGAD